MSIVEYASIPHLDNLAKELLNVLPMDGKDIDISLFQRKSVNFRDIIDNAFPTILVVDYNDIRKELTKFTDIAVAISQDINTSVKVPAKALKLDSKQITSIISAIKSGIAKAIGAAPLITEQEMYLKISSILNTFSVSNTTLAEFKKAFPGIYRISTSGQTKDLYLFPNFNMVSGRINNNINDALDLLATQEETISSIGEVLSYGHTSIGAEGRVLINTPKLMALIVDSLNKSSATNPIKTTTIDSFITTTKQVNSYVEVTKDFTEKGLSVFIKLGGNVVRFENTVINSLKGSVLEKTGTIGTNKAVLAALSKSFAGLDNKFASRISRSLNTLLLGRGSPSIADSIVNTIISKLTGKPPGSFKGVDIKKQSSITKTSSKIVDVSKSTKSTAAILNKLQATKIRASTGQFYSLASLQSLINDLLPRYMEKNMGTGTAKAVLNYRSGRLAESPKVERLSVSREGMISAFYSYMRNPYGTFSQGGAQGSPASRDPKLLISASIREIAATKVANRMRAILI